MKLIEDWKDGWKWASTRCMTLAASLQGAWIAVPEDMKEHIPVSIVSGITIGLLFLGILGRLTVKSDAPTQ